MISPSQDEQRTKAISFSRVPASPRSRKSTSQAVELSLRERAALFLILGDAELLWTGRGTCAISCTSICRGTSSTYDVTENGRTRMHLFSFPGHVTYRASGGTDIHYAPPYTYMRACTCIYVHACELCALCDIHPDLGWIIRVLPNDASNEPFALICVNARRESFVSLI